MNANPFVNVSIPPSKSTPSQLARKNKTCWCREIEDVATPATTGHAFTGKFRSPGMIFNIRLGAVLIHVDESDFAKLGIVVVNSKGTGIIRWIDHCPATAWVGSFAARCRSLCQMSTDDRIREAARNVLSRPGDLDPIALAYWQQLGGVNSDTFDVKREAVELFERVRSLIPPGAIADDVDSFVLKCKATP